MAIVENADLKLTLTIYADEFEDLAALMRDAAKEIKRGSLAGNVGGCIGSYQYDVVEQTRVAEQRDAPVHAEPKCPSCVGMGVVDDGGFIFKCFACDGTGILNRSAGG